ncbi:hypothetical protein JHK85_012392 [Glycine max]|nr:hypothetical protein JHK85_012392 [Glycine max]KAG5057067.1 hypothetical protein JHK86_012063 [Glycine max]
MRKNRVGQNVLTVIIELRRFPLSAMELTNARERENGFNISFYFQGHWPFPRDKLMQGYAYILTHPRTVGDVLVMKLGQYDWNPSKENQWKGAGRNLHSSSPKNGIYIVEILSGVSLLDMGKIRSLA